MYNDILSATDERFDSKIILELENKILDLERTNQSPTTTTTSASTSPSPSPFENKLFIGDSVYKLSDNTGLHSVDNMDFYEQISSDKKINVRSTPLPTITTPTTTPIKKQNTLDYYYDTYIGEINIYHFIVLILIAYVISRLFNISFKFNVNI